MAGTALSFAAEKSGLRRYSNSQLDGRIQRHNCKSTVWKENATLRLSFWGKGAVGLRRELCPDMEIYKANAASINP